VGFSRIRADTQGRAEADPIPLKPTAEGFYEEALNFKTNLVQFLCFLQGFFFFLLHPVGRKK
jgi:hypothetical protein